MLKLSEPGALIAAALALEPVTFLAYLFATSLLIALCDLFVCLVICLVTFAATASLMVFPNPSPTIPPTKSTAPSDTVFFPFVTDSVCQPSFLLCL